MVCVVFDYVCGEGRNMGRVCGYCFGVELVIFRVGITAMFKI